MQSNLVDLCDLDAIVDCRHMQSGLSIDISDFDSRFVLYQYL